MKYHKMMIFLTCLIMQISIYAQSSKAKRIVEPSIGPSDVPELIFTDIPGAPKLSNPILVTGIDQPVFSQGHGLAAPTFYDWDGDGLQDLLIGEFGSGVEFGRNMGNFVRVYKNTGAEGKPEFTGRFDYARPPFNLPGNGTPYSVDQFCCIGFTPQFIDLNNDGKKDMITGSYYGEVYLFPGSNDGFLQGIALPQEYPEEGDPRNGKANLKTHQYYWLYSSASFGDLTGDGKSDLIIGGRELRISKNIGTAVDPKFGRREMLLDVTGNPLKLHEFSDDELKDYEDRKFLGYTPPLSGDEKLSPFVVDWDNDGVLDLLVTNSYYSKGYEAVTFFKGVVANGVQNFHTGISLFKPKKSLKALPGGGPRISVIDWNNDGIKDLLIGVNVITVNGVTNNDLSWNWEKDLEVPPAGKDPANLTGLDDETLERLKKTIKLPKGISIEDYMTIRHQGYIYVMLGRQ